MRAAVLALVSALVVAGSIVALAIRRRAAEWAEWDADPMETDEHEGGVPMVAAWPVVLGHRVPLDLYAEALSDTGPDFFDRWYPRVKDLPLAWRH